MARYAFIARAIDEAGNAVGGSSYEVRIYDDLACTSASVVTDDAAGGTTIAQPLTPNAGTQTTLATTTAAVDTTVTCASVTGFAVGQYIPIFDGTNTVYRFIRSINTGTKVLTLNAAVGFIFSSTNTTVGAFDCVGLVAGFVVDSTTHFIQVKDVASGRLMPPTFLAQLVSNMSIAFQEEGTLVGTRPTVNFVGSGITVTDDAGNNKLVVTMQATTVVGKTADETVASSTALQNDDHLFFAVAANEVWTFEMWFDYHFDGTGGASDGGIQIDFTGPAAATLFAEYNVNQGLGSGSGTAQPATSNAAGGTWVRAAINGFSSASVVSTATTSASQESLLLLRGVVIVGANAGTVQFRWAQQTSQANALRGRKGSRLLAWKVA